MRRRRLGAVGRRQEGQRQAVVPDRARTRRSRGRRCPAPDDRVAAPARHGQRRHRGDRDVRTGRGPVGRRSRAATRRVPRLQRLARRVLRRRPEATDRRRDAPGRGCRRVDRRGAPTRRPRRRQAGEHAHRPRQQPDLRRRVVAVLGCDRGVGDHRLVPPRADEGDDDGAQRSRLADLRDEQGVHQPVPRSDRRDARPGRAGAPAERAVGPGGERARVAAVGRAGDGLPLPAAAQHGLVLGRTRWHRADACRRARCSAARCG